MIRLGRSFAAAAFIGVFTAQSLGAAARMGAMHPMPGRFAPAPKREKPAGPTLWQNLAAIGTWAEQQFAEPLPPPVETPFASYVPPAPEPVEVPRDRIMITGGEGIIGVAPRYFEAELGPTSVPRLRRVYKDRMAAPWREGKGIRFRITYLDSFGRSWIDRKGFHLAIAGSRGRLFHQDAAVPARYWRDYPLYYSGDSVAYEIEMENTGSAPLKSVRVYGKQEECKFTGRPGKPAGALDQQETFSELPIGRTVIRGTFTVGGAAHRGIGYEQTHLTIVAKVGTDEVAVLADDAEAGIIDPPGL